MEWFNSGISDKIKRDATFGLTPRFYRRRAQFKKTSSNKQGQFAFPIAESDGLDLEIRDRLNIGMIKLDTGTTGYASNVKLRRDPDGFFSFTVPDSLENTFNVNYENFAPMQFVVSKVGLSQPKPHRKIGKTTTKRYTASNTMIFKSYVSETMQGKKYITIEKNERDYFELEDGDSISLATIPIYSTGVGASIKRAFNNSIRDQVIQTPGAAGKSLRLYLGNKPEMLQYNTGDLIQCVGIKL